jgi:hypothetical protein
MLFVISSALIYAYKVYTPFEYKARINVLMYLLFTFLVYSLEIKDLYISQMKTKNRFFILNIIFLFLYYYLSMYIPTIIFSGKLINTVHLLSNHFNLKQYNKYFGGYEIF